jgi:hypothetical protein
MTKEIQELSRSIYFSAFSVALISITLMIAVVALLLSIFASVSHKHEDDQPAPPVTHSESQP